ncbi:glycine cleavage system aminomethyltransferase GcvT [Nakamurella leprariae]|uniref:aminomethyltransferase n=1 Tax=Nakamurella leprariae TaxID=2803911 RepID=A0A938YHR4_9ACTN|nr:glycine cleavage system aminomethyltransferase GcvT [Nakamurella leprariae]MBM9468577.1 glycine cleavage system aminomethyltransferase GcvT [Nakamurella leprariae]
MRATALDGIHTALGGAFTDFAGWRMPLRYGSDIAEHHAVRTRAGLFDLSHMGEISVSGPDSAQRLDGAVVGRPSALAVGRAAYTMIVDDDGGIIDDLVVYRLGEQEFLVVANAGNATVVASELGDRCADRGCLVSDDSEDWALLAVQGPRSPAIVQCCSEIDLASLRYYAITRARIAAHEVLLARTGYTGEDGFELYCRPDAAVDIWSTLTTVGTSFGLTPAGLASRDSLRLEAGMPLYGHELTRSVTPFDVGLGRVVKLDKPTGWVGAEALLAAAHRAPTTRLVGLRGRGRRAGRAGHRVLDPRSGAAVGVITSGAPSPTLGYPIAMARIDGATAPVGTELHIDVRGTTEPFDVVELPFYVRSR